MSLEPLANMILKYPNPEKLIYKPAEICIYCGYAEGLTKLSKEHIIPFGLSGSLILPKASCSKCAAVTGAVEGKYLQSMIPDARIHLSLASRRKRRDKSPVPPLRLGIRAENGKVSSWRELPKDQHPYWLITCGFAPPALLSGADPFRKPLVEFLGLPGQDWQSRWHSQPKGTTTTYQFDTVIYARILAKIAHSFTAAEVGINNFRPTLSDIILGKSDKTHIFVGGLYKDKDDRTARPDELHRIDLKVEGQLAIVSMRLFSFIEGTPNYTIVSGYLG